MHVSEIWLYPVKSMIGQTVETAELDSLGLVGDRQWAVRDLERGGIRGAKKLGGLMRCSARFAPTGNRAIITLPDGTETSTDTPDADRLISEAIGARVHLDPLRSADHLEHFRRGAPDSSDPLAEIRAVMGREDDEPLPDFSIFPPEIMEFESPPGAYYDAFPLMLMTTSTMRSLQAALPDSVVDIRRFRPSIVVDTGDQPGYPEFSWSVGTLISVGSATIEVLAPCPRCVMPTREISAAIPQDRAILRYIVRELDQNLGVYARVARPGSFRVGDPALVA